MRRYFANVRNAQGVRTPSSQVEARITASGLRFTAQRGHVYEALCDRRDHPTAEQVFIRVKETHPDISMATVYNCLEKLVRADLVRQVRLDGGATRYCPNMHEHAHFFCDRCGSVHDVAWDEGGLIEKLPLPGGFAAQRVEAIIHGTCPECLANSGRP